MPASTITIYYIAYFSNNYILYCLLQQYQYIELGCRTITIYCISLSDKTNTTIYCNNTILLCRIWYWTYNNVQSIRALQTLYCIRPSYNHNILYLSIIQSQYIVFVRRTITTFCIAYLNNTNILYWCLGQYKYIVLASSTIPIHCIVKSKTNNTITILLCASLG